MSALRQTMATQPAVLEAAVADREAVARVADRPEGRRVPLVGTGTSHDPAKVRRQLADLRKRGGIAVIDDRTPGVGALSVPIVSRDGPEASISVSGPAVRWTIHAMRVAEPRVVAFAQSLASAFGNKIAA